jgi:hypothetical protein
MTRPFAFVVLSAAVVSGCMAKTAPDPRFTLKAGQYDAQEASAGLKLNANAMAPEPYRNETNADLAFTGNYAIQGNYGGLVIWDISNPSKPVLAATYPCPASQNDVSVYRNLAFMSSEGTTSRLDCAPVDPKNPMPPVSDQRMRGVRVFDISDIKNPKLVASVQTCRGSHTHTVVEDPKDRENVYIYVSGSSNLRSPQELAGCTTNKPEEASSALWRIEIIKVPLANPSAAAVVNRANIFSGLKYVPEHAEAKEDIIENKRRVDSARANGGWVADIAAFGGPTIFSRRTTTPLLDSVVKARGGTGAPTAADTAALRANFQRLMEYRWGGNGTAGALVPNVSPISVNNQCHDITVYPSIGLAGGACEGHGMLLDIRDVLNPKRLDAVADTNFSYWHSATFNNDGTKVLFSDEWGGGGAAKCRPTDRKEWGADAIFDIVNGKLEFRSYYKLPTPQAKNETCVAHNGSLIPIPGRDVMVQSWYEGGVSVFDWTDSRKPKEIAYFDRGAADSTRLGNGGTWSVYWYNGALVSSEIGRGLDVMQMVPSEYVSQNEIDAANTVKLTYFNAQGQPKFNWPASFPLAKAYVDQLERNKCLSKSRVTAVRASIASAEAASGAARQGALSALATSLGDDAKRSCDASKVLKLQTTIQDLNRPIVP